MRTWEDFKTALIVANGRRRTRLVSTSEVLSAILRVSVGDTNHICGGNVANAYRYPASMTSVIVTEHMGNIYADVTECNAKKGCTGFGQIRHAKAATYRVGSWSEDSVEVAWISSKAPRGWKFGCDNLGLYIVRRKETRARFRYHFSRNDLITGNVRTEALSHERKQIDAAKKARADAKLSKERAELRKLAIELGVYVSLRDSQRAGNCPTGTKKWADDHGFDVRRVYPMDVVLRAGERNGNKHQVERAVEVAINRTVEDLARGYCEIAYI